jgi:hypothetical protein
MPQRRARRRSKAPYEGEEAFVAFTQVERLSSLKIDEEIKAPISCL